MSERTVYSRNVWHKVLRNSVQRERHSQLTWKAIDINFMHDILIRDFITVTIPCLDSSDSESDTSRWSFSHRDSMPTRATLLAHFSLGIAKFDILPDTL